MKFFVLLLIVMASVNVAAAERNPCVDLEDAEERLACFDAQYGQVAPEPAAAPASTEPGPPTEPVQAERAPAAVTPATSDTDADSAPAPDPIAPAAAAASAPEKTWLGDEKVNLTSTITGILSQDKQKMVFQLENEQIWIQSTPRPLRFEEGDVVTIRNASLGGYFMRTESGVSTRVQRIQ